MPAKGSEPEPASAADAGLAALGVLAWAATDADADAEVEVEVMPLTVSAQAERFFLVSSGMLGRLGNDSSLGERGLGLVGWLDASVSWLPGVLDIQRGANVYDDGDATGSFRLPAVVAPPRALVRSWPSEDSDFMTGVKWRRSSEKGGW